MNAGQDCGTSEAQFEYDQVNSEFDVILKFSIRDSVPLWQAAAQRLRQQGLDADDIDETLGPIDDPAIRDCLLTLTMPDAIEGCQLEEFVARRGGMTPVVTPIDIVTAERKISAHLLEQVAEAEADWRTGLDVPALCVAGTLPGPDHLSALPN